MSTELAPFLLLLLGLVLPGVRTQGHQSTATVAPGGAAAAAGLGPGYAQPTATNSPKHPFCTRGPLAQQPKIPIYHMDVRTGFPDGFRSNQTVVVEITAKYPDVWRIQQVFIHVPDTNPIPLHVQPRAPGAAIAAHNGPKEVGHWAWNLQSNQQPRNPDVGGTQPVDCGGVTSYGPFGVLYSMGAHAAMQDVEPTSTDPSTPFKGYTSIVAKWVPPSDWQSIIYRRTVTIEAFVTFEKTPPTSSAPYSYYPAVGQYQPPKESRWIRKEATIRNLDYVDIHNYLVLNFGPNYQQLFGTPKPIPAVTAEP